MENGGLTRKGLPLHGGLCTGAAVFLILAVFAGVRPALAQCIPREHVQRVAPAGWAWKTNPYIVVFGSERDPRATLVREAVSFWNDRLAELGVSFRLGRVSFADGSSDLDDYAEETGRTVLARGRMAPWPPPDALLPQCGRIVVVLTGRNFISYARLIQRLGLALVGIKSDTQYPFDLSNVARNVIAHELGHAIGLRHNDDDTSLMCGRPAPCRPTAFESPRQHYFPLTKQETDWLMRHYGS